MKCKDCINIENCGDKMDEPELVGCTSGTPSRPLLKACPFCGGSVRMFLYDIIKGECGYVISHRIEECKSYCGVFMESRHFYIHDPNDVKERIKKNLVEMWNRRI